MNVLLNFTSILSFLMFISSWASSVLVLTFSLKRLVYGVKVHVPLMRSQTNTRCHLLESLHVVDVVMEADVTEGSQCEPDETTDDMEAGLQQQLQSRATSMWTSMWTGMWAAGLHSGMRCLKTGVTMEIIFLFVVVALCFCFCRG